MFSNLRHWVVALRRQLEKRQANPKASKRKYRFRPMVEVLEDRTAPAVLTYTVDTVMDNVPLKNGMGSLRAIIDQVNKDPAGDTEVIKFDIGKGGVQTLQLAKNLPEIKHANVTVDGSSQPRLPGDTTTAPLIQLDGRVQFRGRLLFSLGYGLQLEGGNDSVRGLAIFGFDTGIGVSKGKGNSVINDYIGLNNAGQAIGNETGVYVKAEGTIIGGTAQTDKSGAITVPMDVISGNLFRGIYVSSGGSGTKIQGCFIGTNPAGDQPLGNGTKENKEPLKQYAGIELYTVNHVTIGGRELGQGNVISATGAPKGSGQKAFEEGYGSGILVVGPFFGPSDLFIQGNLIGTDRLGTTAMGNAGNGITLIDVGSFRNKGPITVGGSAAENNGVITSPSNVISGNGGYGIFIKGGHVATVEGNFIGINRAGLSSVGADGKPMGNTLAGIFLKDVGEATIGGNQPQLANVISGNGQGGVVIQDSANIAVVGSLIGTDKTGNAAIKQSGGNGVTLIKSLRCIIGLGGGQQNVISGNQGNGVSIEKGSGQRNMIENNLIGLGLNGKTQIGNGKAGIYIDKSSTGNLVKRDKIAFNKDAGVVEEAKGNNNVADPNLIYDNGGMGIQLSAEGEALHATPLLASATQSNGNATVTGTLQNLPNTTYLIEFFNDNEGDRDGEAFLGSMNVTTNGSGFASFQQTFAGSGIQYGFITATSTFVSSQVSSANPGTSEYSIPAHFHIPTATAITSSQNPSLLTQPVTFTAVVAPTFGTGTPTGAVEFFNGTTEIGAGQLAVVGGSDQATFTTSALGVGAATITAVYVGDANFNGSFGSTSQIVQTPTPLALGLFNTGTNANDQTVTGNPIDLHYTVQYFATPTSQQTPPPAPASAPTNGTAETAYVATNQYYFPDSSTSRWITINPNTNQIEPLGLYLWTMQVTVPAGVDPSQWTVQGQWSSDNQGVGIYLNGQLTNNSVTGLQAYQGFSPFTLTGLHAGTNTVQFLVFNSPVGAGSINPTALRVEFTSIAVPNAPPASTTESASILDAFFANYLELMRHPLA